MDQDEDYLPICHTCGQPMQLVGPLPAPSGQVAHAEGEHYAFQCCGYEMTLEDPELAEIAVRNLKKFHKIS